MLQFAVDVESRRSRGRWVDGARSRCLLNIEDSPVYAYLPQSNKLCPDGSNTTNVAGPSGSLSTIAPLLNSITCTDDYGTSISRGSFNFTRGA